MQLSGGTQRLGGLSDAAWSAEAIPIRRLPKARFSGAALIAKALDPSEGRLFHAVASSRQKDLSEIIRQTLGPDGESRIQQAWGRGYEELATVFREPDEELFYRSLFAIAQRLESGSLEKAALVYAVLAGAGKSASLVAAGGEKSSSAQLALAEVGKQAEHRFKVLTEGGNGWEAVAFSLGNMPAQFSRWDWITAMAGGQLAFRGVQAFATARFAKTFESAWLLNGVATGTGVLAESLAVTGLATATGALPGGPDAIAKNWASGASMVVGFRALHGAFGKLSANWAVGESTFARWTRVATPQAAMLTGLVAYGRVAQSLDLPAPSNGGNILVNAATMMVTGKIAGRIQNQFAGPGLSSFEFGAQEYARSVFALRQGPALGLSSRWSATVGTDPQFRTFTVGTDPQFRVGTDPQFRSFQGGALRARSVGTDPQFRVGTDPQFRTFGIGKSFGSVGTDPQFRVGTDPQFRIGTDGIRAGLLSFLPAPQTSIFAPAGA